MHNALVLFQAPPVSFSLSANTKDECSRYACSWGFRSWERPGNKVSRSVCQRVRSRHATEFWERYADPFDDLRNTTPQLAYKKDEDESFWFVVSAALLRLDRRMDCLVATSFRHVRICAHDLIEMAFGCTPGPNTYADVIRGFPMDENDLHDESPDKNFVPIEGEFLEACLANREDKSTYQLFVPSPIANPIPGAREWMRKLILKAECGLFGHCDNKVQLQLEARQAATDYADVKFSSPADWHSVSDWCLEDVVWKKVNTRNVDEDLANVVQTAERVAASGGQYPWGFLHLYHFEIPHFKQLLELEQEWAKVKTKTAKSLLSCKYWEEETVPWDEKLKDFDGNAGAHLFKHYLDMQYFYEINLMPDEEQKMFNKKGLTPWDHKCFWSVVEVVLFRLGNKIRWLIQRACRHANVGMEEFVYHLLGSRNRPYTALDYYDVFRGFVLDVDTQPRTQPAELVKFPEIEGKLLESFQALPRPVVISANQIIEGICGKLDNLPPGATEFIRTVTLCAEEELFKGCGNKAQLVLEARTAVKEGLDLLWYRHYHLVQHLDKPFFGLFQLPFEEVVYTEDLKFGNGSDDITRIDDVVERADKVAVAGGITKWGLLSLYEFELESQFISID